MAKKYLKEAAKKNEVKTAEKCETKNVAESIEKSSAENNTDKAVRSANVERKTKETDIKVSLCIDGSGKNNIETDIPFFDHCLESFAKHGSFDLELKTVGDVIVDNHHSVEDTGIVLGQAFCKALGNKENINRYASFIQPMDDALVLVSVDLCSRPYLNFKYEPTVERVGYFETETLREFFYAFSYSAAMNIHVKVLDGDNTHHIIEAMFKAFANALRIAVSTDGNREGILSTKGTI